MKIKMKIINKTKICFILFFLLPLAMWAHPHLFIDYTADLIFDEFGLVGVKTEWTFDEMFSWQILSENTNRDQIIDDQERENIEKNAFSYLKESGYFSFFLEENERFKVTKIKNFSPRIENGRVIYSFFIPWKVKAENKPKYLKFLFDDESYFCAVTPQKDGVKIINNSKLKAEISMLDQVSFQISFWK